MSDVGVSEELLERELFRRHIPTILRERQERDFDENVLFELGNRIVGEFWEKHNKEFVRNESTRLSIARLPPEIRGKWDLEVVLKSVLAAEIETRILPPMTGIQKEELAEIYVQLGDALSSFRFFQHAKQCFRRAAGIYGELRRFSYEDLCWYRHEKCSAKMSNGWEKAWSYFLDVVSGFGYKPYRLIFLALFLWGLMALVYFAVDTELNAKTAALLSISGQLGFVGYSDIRTFPGTIEVVSIVQSCLSLVLNTTLFALLVRKWFR